MALFQSTPQPFTPGARLEDGSQINSVLAIPQVSMTSGQTATGATQATAVPMTSAITQFATVAANTGGILANLVAGQAQDAYNDGASPLTVYPPLGGNIDGAGVNVGVPLANAKRCRYTCTSPGIFESAQLGAVSA